MVLVPLAGSGLGCLPLAPCVGESSQTFCRARAAVGECVPLILEIAAGLTPGARVTIGLFNSVSYPRGWGCEFVRPRFIVSSSSSETRFGCGRHVPRAGNRDVLGTRVPPEICEYWRG